MLKIAQAIFFQSFEHVCQYGHLREKLPPPEARNAISLITLVP